jgi:hypothetical protein
MFKRLLLLASANLFTLSIFCLITLGSLTQLVRPAPLKKWLSSGNVYQKLPAAFINQAAREQGKEQNPDGSDISLSDPNVKQAAEQALSPAFFQRSVEGVIDGSFHWLDGQKTKPDFNVDVLSVKQNFADNLGSYFKQRYQALPVCANGALPSSTDLLKINCRPSDGNFDIDQAISDQKLLILQNKDFLGQSSITADSLGDSDQGNQSKVFDQKAIPRAYRAFRLSPLVFAGLAVLSGLIVVLLCEVKKFGVRKLGWRFIVAGILALLATTGGIIALTKIRSLTFHQSADSAVTPFREAIASTINAARADIIKYNVILSVAALLVGGIILWTTRSVSRKAKKQAAQDRPAEQPQPVDEKPGEEKRKPAPQPSTAPGVKTPAPTKPRLPKRTLIQ